MENQVFNMILANPEKGITVDTYPALLYRKTPISHFLANFVSWTASSDTPEARASLSRVVEAASQTQKSFGVFLNHPEIVAFGEALGMRKVARYLGVNCDVVSIPDNLVWENGIEVREACDSDRDSFLNLLAQCFEMPEPVAQFFVDESYFNHEGIPVKNYLAFVGGTPVGFGSLLDYPMASVYAMLGGGGVLKEYRGRGVYRALLARRIAESKRTGKKTLICMADEKTSAPILKLNGFSTLSTHDLFVYFPT